MLIGHDRDSGLVAVGVHPATAPLPAAAGSPSTTIASGSLTALPAC